MESCRRLRPRDRKRREPLVSVGAASRVRHYKRTCQLGDGSERKAVARDLRDWSVGGPRHGAESSASRTSGSAALLVLVVHSTSPAPAAPRARVAGGAEEPLLARRIGSSKRRRQDAYAAPRRRRPRPRSRRLSLRRRERLCSTRANAALSELVQGGSGPPFGGSARTASELTPSSQLRITSPANDSEWSLSQSRRSGRLAEAVSSAVEIRPVRKRFSERVTLRLSHRFQ
jgi:hypothetical protein